MFDPRLTMVISVQPTTCPDSNASTRSFNELRLVLPHGAGTIDVPGVGLTLTTCAPTITPFSYDSADE